MYKVKSKPLTVFGIEIAARCPLCHGQLWIAAPEGPHPGGFGQAVNDAIRQAAVEHRYSCPAACPSH